MFSCSPCTTLFSMAGRGAFLCANWRRLYEAFRDGKPSPLAGAAHCSTRTIAVWQRRHLQGKNLEKQLAYWKTQLAKRPQS